MGGWARQEHWPHALGGRSLALRGRPPPSAEPSFGMRCTTRWSTPLPSSPAPPPSCLSTPTAGSATHLLPLALAERHPPTATAPHCWLPLTGWACRPPTPSSMPATRGARRASYQGRSSVAQPASTTSATGCALATPASAATAPSTSTSASRLTRTTGASALFTGWLPPPVRAGRRPRQLSTSGSLATPVPWPASSRSCGAWSSGATVRRRAWPRRSPPGSWRPLAGAWAGLTRPHASPGSLPAPTTSCAPRLRCGGSTTSLYNATGCAC